MCELFSPAKRKARVYWFSMSIVHTKQSGVAFELVTVFLRDLLEWNFHQGAGFEKSRFLQCSVLGKKTKDLAIGCLRQITLTEGLCLTANVWLLQTCVEPKKTSLWIDTIIPYNTSWSRQHFFAVLVTKKNENFWEGARKCLCLFFLFFSQELPGWSCQ